MLRNNYLTALFVLCIATSRAQETPCEINIKEKLYKVGWIEQTNDGLIMAAGDKGLFTFNLNAIGESSILSRPLEGFKTATV